MAHDGASHFVPSLVLPSPFYLDLSSPAGVYPNSFPVKVIPTGSMVDIPHSDDPDIFHVPCTNYSPMTHYSLLWPSLQSPLANLGISDPNQTISEGLPKSVVPTLIKNIRRNNWVHK